VPFDFLKRRKDDDQTPDGPTAEVAARSDRLGSRGVAFDGLTEEWRIVGWMQVDGRLSDVLNRREAIDITDVKWAPVDDASALDAAPGLRTVDPYDLIIVLAGEGSLPPLDEAERAAHKVHKIAYDVALEVPPFRVVGTVYLYPGSDPDRLLDRATEMFTPVVDAEATHHGRPIGERMDAILINRFYLRGVEQVDRSTGLPSPKLPGGPMGGTSWQDRSR
jgi:hypothetical protein